MPIQTGRAKELMKRIVSFQLFLLFLLPYLTFAQNKFKPGDQLPELVLSPVYGDSIRTSQLKGKKILITFNRYVSCPLCNFRTHELLEHYDTLKLNGLVIISIYEFEINPHLSNDRRHWTCHLLSVLLFTK